MIQQVISGDQECYFLTKEQESAAIVFAFRAGNYYEKVDQLGVSHLIEHLIFRHLNQTGLLDQMESLGAVFRATTNKDYLQFSIVGHKKHLVQIAQEFLQAFFTFKSSASDIRKEIPILVRELVKYDSSLNNLLSEYLWRELLEDDFESKTKARQPEIEKLTVSTFRFFKHDYLTADRLFVIGVGDRGFLDSLSGLRRTRNRNRTPIPAATLQSGNNKIIKAAKVKESLIGIAFNCIKPFSINQLVLELVCLKLTGKMSSVLFKRLRYEQPLTYSLQSQITTLFNSSLFVSITLQAESKNVVGILDIVTQEIEQFSQNLLSIQELESLKQSLYSNHLLLTSNYEQLLPVLVSSVIYEQDSWIRDKLHLLQQITPETIKQVCSDYLTVEQQKVVVITSESDSRKIQF